MQLALDRISKKVGAEQWLFDISLTPRMGEVTVLLGTTQAGKTSLMRIMAGLDVPSTGHVRVDGSNVTGMPVRERNVAMVYQQFINYPSLKVFDNIASPLKLRREKKHRPACARDRRASAYRDVPGPLPGRAVGWPAAAGGPGACAGKAARFAKPLALRAAAHSLSGG